MIWLWTSIASAVLIGVYDILKKDAVRRNGVLEVLLVTTGISSLFFLPLVVSSLAGWGLGEGTLFEMPRGSFYNHLMIFIKALLVSGSWISGILALKYLPLTTVGIFKASRPAFVTIGCVLLFAERPNPVQWIGVAMAFLALYLLSRTSRRKENISFTNNRWAWCMALSVLFGVVSALFDKGILQQLNEPIFLQAWCNIYITLIMALSLLVWSIVRRSRGIAAQKFHWDWALLLIAVFITLSDFFYFFSLSREGSLLLVVSMLRRSSVVVSFIGGAIVFHEHNLRDKALEMVLLLAGMAVILFGSYLWN